MSPNVLAALEEERQFSDNHQKSKARRVKIEKVNQAWLVRFLPVGLGERNLWYLRLGQHWANKRPIFCPRCVSPDLGGDPNAECPVCEMAKNLNASEDEAISSYGFKLKANLTYLTYCLVYQIDTGHGETQEMPESEVLKPWEFQHYKSSFDELMDYYRRGVTDSRPFSVMDLEKGNDFWATRTVKGTRLDRQDPSPIFDLADPRYDAKIAEAWGAITPLNIKMPTLKDLSIFAHKAEDAASSSGGGESKERSLRGRNDESDEPVDRPGRRISRAPMRYGPPATETAPDVAEDDQLPDAEVPVRAPVRAAVPVGRAVTRPGTVARVVATAPAPAPRPAARSATAPAGRPAPLMAGRPVAVSHPAARPTAAKSTVDPETEDPGIAEEDTDAAPPADELPPDQDEDAGDQADGVSQEEVSAAPVSRQTHTAPAANAGLRQRLMSRVKTV